MGDSPWLRVNRLSPGTTNNHGGMAREVFGFSTSSWSMKGLFNMSIPISYQKYLVSRRKNKTAILKRGCRKWHVKIDNDWVFGEGWEAFVRDNVSCEREYPIHKARRACLEKKSYGKCKTDTDVLKKTPKVKDTYINISLKSEKSIIPDHNNHPYFIGTLKASSKKLIYQGNYYCIGQGWSTFYIENGLKQGDHFKLEFVQTEIYSIATFYPLHLGKEPAESHEVVETEGLNCHRHFVGTLKHHDMSRKHLLIPKAFALANRLSSGELILKYAEKEDTWTVKMEKLRKCYYYIRRGLHEFCIINGLENRDIIKFELIQNGEKPVAVISIADELQLPSVSNPSEEVSSAGWLIKGCFSIEPSAGMLLSGLADASGHSIEIPLDRIQ
ncbi:B3 DNA binding domain-containing protein [Tanacetum coccineum]